MATAGEIRKRVREAERERLKAREAAAVDVARTHERREAAKTALAAAEQEFRVAVNTATNQHGFIPADLAAVTGLSRASLRATQPTRSNNSNQDAAQPADLPD